MHVALHALQMRPTVTGTDRLARNVVRQLQSLDQSNDYTVFCFDDDTFVPTAVGAPHFSIRRIRRRKLAGHGFPAPRLDPPADVELSFHNLVVPLPKRAPTVVTVLDLIPLATRHYHPSATWRAVHRRLIERAARLGDRFVAISEFTKAELVRRCRVPPALVTVAPLGVDEVFTRESSAEALADARARYGLDGRFVLIGGGADPRKNARTAVAAYRRLPAAVRRDVAVAIVGASWHGREPADARDVRALGHVPDEDMRALLTLADAFVFVSLYEGFGLPPLEAMACGAPVICSRATALREVVGDAAVLVDATDERGLTVALRELLSQESSRRELRARGRARAAAFSWERTASGFLQALEAAAHG